MAGLDAMASFVALLWLKFRHLRTELAWWGYIAGTDLVGDTDLIDRIYHLYLVVLLGAWGVSSWAFLLEQVEASCSVAGPMLQEPLLLAVAALPLAGLVVLCFNAVRTSPLKLTNADVAYLASGAFPVSAIAVVDTLPALLAAALLGGAAAFLLADGAVAAGAAADPWVLCAFGAISLAAAFAVARAAGYACVSVPASRALRRWLAAAGIFAAVCAYAVAVAVLLLPQMAEVLLGSPASLLPGTVTQAVIWSVVLTRTASGADLIRIIEESGAYAHLAGLRHMAFAAPDTYRELRRRYRVAHHRVRPRVPLARGPAALVTRALLSHLRQFEGVFHLLHVGLVLVPTGVVVLSAPSHPALCAAWGLLLLSSLGAVRELSLAFREDKRVRLIRDLLPCSDVRLALCDAVPAFAAIVLLSALALGGIHATAPGLLCPASAAQAAVLCADLSLAAALDGAELPYARKRPSAGAGLIVVAVVAGAASLIGPEAVVGGMALLALAFAAILSRSR